MDALFSFNLDKTRDICNTFRIWHSHNFRFSAPAGAWMGQMVITKCRVRGADPGGASCPVKVTIGIRTIPNDSSQDMIPTRGQKITTQFGER